MLRETELSLLEVERALLWKAWRSHCGFPLLKEKKKTYPLCLIVRNSFFMVIIAVLTLGWIMEQTDDLQHFVYLSKANWGVWGFCVQANVVLVGKGSSSHVEGGVGRQHGLRVTVRPPSCSVVWVLRKVQGPDRAASSRSHVLAPPAERGLGVDCVNLQMIHMSIQMCACVLWSWEASSVPEANLTTVKFTTFLRSWDSALSKTIMSLRALSSGSGQVWFRCDSVSDLISMSAGSSGHPLQGVGISLLPLLQCVIAESQTLTWPLLIHMCLERRREDIINSLSTSKVYRHWLVSWYWFDTRLINTLLRMMIIITTTFPDDGLALRFSKLLSSG